VLLITSGDLRLSANQECWPAQREMEEKLTAAFAQKGIKLVRAHAYNEKEKHGFISSQRMGMDVFMNIHPRRGWSLRRPRGNTRIMCCRDCAATRGRF
jgi:cold shock CspA family protein